MEVCNDDDNATTSHILAAAELPISCTFCRDVSLFRVNRSKGKMIAAGGYGVFIRNSDNNYVTNVVNMGDTCTDAAQGKCLPVNFKNFPESDGQIATTSLPNNTSLFLFIEEVIFLHERGLIEAYVDTSNHNIKHRLQSFELYNLLPVCHISLASYLIYAHLRNQTFRVFRHTEGRRLIIENVEGAICARNALQAKEPSAEGTADRDHDTADPTNSKSEKVRLDENVRLWRMRLRQDCASAPSPRLICYDTIIEKEDAKPKILYDVYNPNSQFSRSHPGLPDYYVTGTYYNSEQALTFSDICNLLADADGIPLRIATVSDSGTVVTFGVTDFGVPDISNDNSDFV